MVKFSVAYKEMNVNPRCKHCIGYHSAVRTTQRGHKIHLKGHEVNNWIGTKKQYCLQHKIMFIFSDFVLIFASFFFF